MQGVTSFIGANRLSGCAAWSLGAHNNTTESRAGCGDGTSTFTTSGLAKLRRDGLLAFGAGWFVGLYDVAVRGVMYCATISPGHAIV